MTPLVFHWQVLGMTTQLMLIVLTLEIFWHLRVKVLSIDLPKSVYLDLNWKVAYNFKTYIKLLNIPIAQVDQQPNAGDFFPFCCRLSLGMGLLLWTHSSSYANLAILNFCCLYSDFLSCIILCIWSVLVIYDMFKHMGQ